MYQKLLVNQAKLDSANVSEDDVNQELDRRLNSFISQLGSKEAVDSAKIILKKGGNAFRLTSMPNEIYFYVHPMTCNLNCAHRRHTTTTRASICCQRIPRKRTEV